MQKVIFLFLINLMNYIWADDLDKAPPGFDYKGKKAVFTDFLESELQVTFDFETKKTYATNMVVFRLKESGYPLFDLVAKPYELSLNSRVLKPSLLKTIQTPGNETSLKFLDTEKELSQETEHTLIVKYILDTDSISLNHGEVRAGFFMSDISATGREFWEQYALSNLEYDAFSLFVRLQINGSEKIHTVYTNGEEIEIAPNVWEIKFPSYFTTSSPFIHFVPKGRFYEISGKFDGAEGSIPVKIYSPMKTLSEKGMRAAQRVLLELENTYGPIAHPKVVAYITPTGGGMEYCGATMTSMRAIEHEFTHFWFARGIMPANGNSGWVDEAIASWRDYGYPQAKSRPERKPVKMVGTSPYKRDTSILAYSDGMQLMSEFDFILADRGGLKPVLKQLYEENKNQTFTLPFFKNFMEKSLNEDLTAIFEKYVLGIVKDENDVGITNDDLIPIKEPVHKRYTRDEIRQYH